MQPGAGLGAFSVPGLLAGLFVEAPDYPRTRAVPEMELDLGGIPGSRHHGHVRGAGPREPWYRRGMPMRHGRQVSAVSIENLAAIGCNLGIECVHAEWLGANLLVEGVPDFSWLPIGTRLHFAEASLVVEAQNAPCVIVGREIAASTGADVSRRFARAARGLRGLVLSVERAGTLRSGEPFRLDVPAQRLWTPPTDAPR